MRRYHHHRLLKRPNRLLRAQAAAKEAKIPGLTQEGKKNHATEKSARNNRRGKVNI
jgi:hypothetical protein